LVVDIVIAPPEVSVIPVSIRVGSYLTAVAPGDPLVAIEAEHQAIGDHVAADHAVHPAALDVVEVLGHHHHQAGVDREVTELEAAELAVAALLLGVGLVDPRRAVAHAQLGLVDDLLIDRGDRRVRIDQEQVRALAVDAADRDQVAVLEAADQRE
jgi:hypothetical protein